MYFDVAFRSGFRYGCVLVDILAKWISIDVDLNLEPWDFIYDCHGARYRFRATKETKSDERKMSVGVVTLPKIY
jgi:hypothetical protein